MKRILPLLFLFFCSMPVYAGENLLLDDFESGLSPEWRVNQFKGKTVYQIVTDGSTKVLQADSNNTASGLIYQQEFLLADYPVISWRWKIDGIVENGDVAHKQTDDYAARIYIIFQHWFYPMTKSINYIWANKLEKGRIVPSPFTSNSMMIAIESGSSNAGSWQLARRNIVDDYRRAFGVDPPKKAVIAIMTDTENTGGKARAWYDDIWLEKE